MSNHFKGGGFDDRNQRQDIHLGSQPAPIPSSILLSLIVSIVETILASRAGFLYELQVTNCPKRILEVIEQRREKHKTFKKVFLAVTLVISSSHQMVERICCIVTQMLPNLLYLSQSSTAPRADNRFDQAIAIPVALQIQIWFGTSGYSHS